MKNRSSLILLCKGLENKKNQIILVPFLKWSNENVFLKKKETFVEKISGSVGFMSGAISAYVMFSLGAGFGKIASNFLEIKDMTTKNNIINFFGINALVPMVALGATATKDNFQQMTSPHSQELVKINKKSNKNKKRLVTLSYFLAVFSAIPQSSLTYRLVQDSNFLSQMIVIPAFIGPFFFNVNAELQLVNKFFDSLTKREADLMRSELRNKLHSSMKAMTHLEDDQINLLFEELINSESGEGQEKILRKIKIIFNIHPNAQPEIKEEKIFNENTLSRKITKLTGFSVGATSAYVYYGLGKLGMSLICEKIGMQDPEILEILCEITGVLAYIPNAALSAISTQDRFEQIYNGLLGYSKNDPKYAKSWPGLRRLILGFSIFEGVMSATPLTYIALESAIQGSWIQKSLVIPTFIGPASVRSLAVERLLNRGLDWIDSRYYNTTATQRDKLIKMILKIDYILKDMKEEQIGALHQQVTKCNMTLFKRTLSHTPASHPQEKDSSHSHSSS